MTNEEKAREIAADIFRIRAHLTQEYAARAITAALDEARREALEEAARVADVKAKACEAQPFGETRALSMGLYAHIAAAIRNLGD